jgi:DNA polymerase-1
LLLLIDGDILVYQALTSAEKEVEWEPDLWTLWANHADAKDNFVTALVGIIARATDHGWNPDTDQHLVVLSDSEGNWRKEIYPKYKSNRKQRKPLGYKDFRKWVASYYKTVQKPKLEADDCIGILATKPGADALIWSIDKDFKTIPGKHLKDDGIVTIDEDEADYWFLMQTLTGDATDGYPGLPGVGPKKAEAILCDEISWFRVRDAYVKAGLTEDDAIMQARMARILRWNDWDKDKQEVILWTPTQ